MPKRVTAFELMLSARDPKTPAYRWIYGALRTEILEGRLRPGSRLPSSRDLALQYRLSRGTIVTAFEQLKSEGYIEGTIGSGSYVSRSYQSSYCRWEPQGWRPLRPRKRGSAPRLSCSRFGTVPDGPSEICRNTLAV